MPKVRYLFIYWKIEKSSSVRGFPPYLWRLGTLSQTSSHWSFRALSQQKHQENIFPPPLGFFLQMPMLWRWHAAGSMRVISRSWVTNGWN